MEFILNKADDSELEVISEALKKRLKARKNGPSGIDINYLAHSTGETISRQVSSSREYIRKTVTEYVAKIIRQHAPGITDDQLKVLLDEWVAPDLNEGKSDLFPEKPAARQQERKGKDEKIPPDMVVRMIDQFMRFAKGRMPLDEQANLREYIPNWQEEYWKSFPAKIRGLLTLYLREKIDSETCWEEIKQELFNDSGKQGEQQ